MFTSEENQNLNEELIEEEQTEINPKRGSKDEIIQKIYDLSDKANIPIEESLTKLKRKSKSTLNKMLAELVEKSVEKSIANKLGNVHKLRNAGEGVWVCITEDYTGRR